MIVLKWNRSAEKGYFLLHTNENFDHWFGWTWAINTRETANRNSIGRNSVERKKKELGNWNALAPSEIFIYGERVLFFSFVQQLDSSWKCSFPAPFPYSDLFQLNTCSAPHRAASRQHLVTIPFRAHQLKKKKKSPMTKTAAVADTWSHLGSPRNPVKPSKTQ